MKGTVTIQLDFEISIGKTSIDEIIFQLKENRDPLMLVVLSSILSVYEAEIVKRLTEPRFPEERAGLGQHIRKGENSRTCGGRRMNPRGKRSRARRLSTVFGKWEHIPVEVECRRCGKRFAPLFSALKMERWQQDESNLERQVLESVIDTNYRRLREGLSVDVSLGGIHNYVVESGAGQVLEEEVIDDQWRGVMADGTGLKKSRGARGELRAVIGTNKHGRVVPLGTWVDTPWDVIETEVKKKVKENKGDLNFVYDGEPGLDGFLEGIVRGQQRCVWHGPRGLYHSLWEDGLKKMDMSGHMDKLQGLLGIEIPKSDYELVKDEDKLRLKDQYDNSRRELMSLIEEFDKKGYAKGATYLHNLARDIFRNVELWLKTGVIFPKTTSLLERVFRELGRRLKRIAWGWSDAGAAKLSQMILLKQYSREKWEKFWKEKMDICGNFKLVINSVSAELC
jgi:hypothetical protein